MANELAWRHTATGATLYCTIRSEARTYWNTDTDGPALEALTVANWYHAAASDGNYHIALTETPGSSYFYVGSWPALLTTVGWYYIDVFQQAGANPAISDTLAGGMLLYWNGTTARPQATDVAQVSGTAQTAGDITAVLNATSAIKRATALSNLTFLMTLNRAPVTGATVTSYIKKDAGAFGATTNSVSEIANGLYAISLTATEMTATVVTLRFTASGCDDLVITLPVGS